MSLSPEQAREMVDSMNSLFEELIARSIMSEQHFQNGLLRASARESALASTAAEGLKTRIQQALLSVDRRAREECASKIDPVVALLHAMETCHICGGALTLDSDPVHCENCSWDCEEHEDPACEPLQTLHQRARIAVKAIRASITGGTNG